MMSAESGILEAFAFGGPKSKLRSLASPWSSGRAFLYRDPVRDLLKLSDFEVRESFGGLRESLSRIAGATLVSELLLKTSGGGGDFPEVLELARDSLRALDDCPEERCDYPTLLFLWRLVALLGLMPDPDACAACDSPLGPAQARPWSHGAGGFLCPRCARDAEDEGLGLSAGAARWLSRAAEQPFAEALRLGLDSSSLKGLKALAVDLARRAAEAPLSSLNLAGSLS